MNISPRTKEILKILCEKDIYITIESISQRLDVSSRTVLRELIPVEKWLLANGYALEKKKGTGILLKVKDTDKAQIMNMLVTEKTSKTYAPEERQTVMLMELLIGQKVLKAMYFNSLFNITDGTVSSDLDKVEKWLGKYNLKLIRRPGLGVYITGNEKDIRNAVADLLYEHATPDQIMDFVRGGEVTFSNRIWRFIDKDITDTLKTFIGRAEALLGYELADDAYSALAIHLAVAFTRIRKKETVHLDTTILRELQKSREYSIASQLLNEIALLLKLEIPDQEVGYIAMYLKGCKGRTAQQGEAGFEAYASEDLKLIMLVKKMIQIAQLETGCYMEEDEKLFQGLVRHLGTAINRIKMNMNIRNPLKDEIMNYYPELYRTAEKCAAAAEELENIKVPDSEIAYIAMHLGAVMENSKKVRSTYNIAIACASGIGTSRLLSSRLEKEFKNLEVVETISTINPDIQQLREKGIDFVVSTVPIPDFGLPVVVVHPLLIGNDKHKLEEFIKNIQTENYPGRNLPDKQVQLKDRLQMLNQFNLRIMQLLDNFAVMENLDANDVDQLIAEVSHWIHKDPVQEEARAQLCRDLKRRELQGSVLLEHKGIMLLHCRTHMVDQIYFRVVRLQHPLDMAGADGDNVEISVVALMLAPVEAPKIAIAILSEITRALVENEEFVASIRDDLEEKVYNKLSFILYQFYQIKSMNNGN